MSEFLILFAMCTLCAFIGGSIGFALGHRKALDMITAGRRRDVFKRALDRLGIDEQGRRLPGTAILDAEVIE